ncbi:DnaT-like ssDNA-binding protein [Methanoculleus sp.]|jgi:hypothetical protein|uniref:DnaT-like ssDNA-binding protein n=1 Tax=Methanoculleus sp. TaxID=90427 RepID=UPI0025F662E0|nr:DnaT-like ssDNA-binding protein [Methanoculleus sp.]MCK9319927.1 hypothetical protein [Methanoculleus sp.]
MAIVFDSTVGGASANSYASVADYAQYRENAGLSARTAEQAQVDLIRATTFIEMQYLSLWQTQSKTESTQALHWPQSGAVDVDGSTLADDEIPDRVKKAVYEYAIRAESQTGLDPKTKTNIKSQDLDGLGNQEFFSPVKDGSLPDAFKFLDKILYGLISDSSGGVRIIKAVRG